MNILRNPDRRPTHPGALLREDVLPALHMSQTELADRLGVSRVSVSELLHEKRALSPEMALRLSKLLDTTPESWLTMQMAVDVWEVRHESAALDSVKPLPKKRESARPAGCGLSREPPQPRLTLQTWRKPLTNCPPHRHQRVRGGTKVDGQRSRGLAAYLSNSHRLEDDCDQQTTD
jgi:addiction module HigA family antidote